MRPNTQPELNSEQQEANQKKTRRKISKSNQSRASSRRSHSGAREINTGPIDPKTLIQRKLEITRLNNNLLNNLNDTEDTPLCLNHVEQKGIFFDKHTQQNLCLDCAAKETLLNKQLAIGSNLNKHEFKKKTKSDEFIQRLEFFQICMNGYLERNERILHESIERHKLDVSQINLFFEQISAIFTEVYNKLVGEKTSQIEDIKKEHQVKKFHLIENINNIHKFEADIIENYDNIILGMGLEPFNGIMTEYKGKVDQIQDFCDHNSLDKYPNYKEIRPNGRKVEGANKAIQGCVTLIYEAFDEKFGGETPEKEGNNDNRNSLMLKEEMNRINACFYSNNSRVIKGNFFIIIKLDESKDVSKEINLTSEVVSEIIEEVEQPRPSNFSNVDSSNTKSPNHSGEKKQQFESLKDSASFSIPNFTRNNLFFN